MKISSIRNEFIKQSVIIMVAVAIVFTLLYYLSSFIDEKDNEINTLKSAVNEISGKSALLNSEYSQVTATAKLYEEIKEKKEKKMLEIKKSTLKEAIDVVRKEHFFESPDVKISDIKLLTDPKYKKETMQLESSEVTISAKFMSDVEVFYLIKSIQDYFAAVKFSSVKMELQRNLDNETLLAIKSKGFSPIVDGKIIFTIMGLKEIGNNEQELPVIDNATPKPKT